jgi:hypothetical protein
MTLRLLTARLLAAPLLTARLLTARLLTARLLTIGLLACGVTLAVAPLVAPLVANAAQPISLNAATARDLAELCGANPREPAADAKINYCHGFAQGALDVERKHAEETKLFCFPPNPPSRSVVMGEFVNWVRAVPEHQSQSALAGLFHFFGERFPCK